jgi:hypothetical protein
MPCDAQHRRKRFPQMARRPESSPGRLTPAGARAPEPPGRPAFWGMTLRESVCPDELSRRYSIIYGLDLLCFMAYLVDVPFSRAVMRKRSALLTPGEET